MKRQKGSITIFSVLSLLLISAALFAMLEGTRFQEMRRFATLQTQTALESVFANYNTGLWENYHLLGTNTFYMQEILEKAANGREGTGANLLKLVPQEVRVTEETRITDGEGTVFIASVAAYMKENLVYETIKEVYSQYEAIKQILDSSNMDLSNIQEALDELNESEKETKSIAVETSGKTSMESQVDIKDLLENAKEWQEMGLLTLVVSDTESLSYASQECGNGLLERELETGNDVFEYEITYLDRILLQQYLLSYMSCFSDEKENHALSYELEYLLGQKNSDLENLNVVTMKLLALREAVNFLFLLSNPNRVAEAETVALLFVGTTANPLLIEVVKTGVLTAWAFAESILDVRALLAGKRIALLKSEENWTMKLEDFGQISTDFVMAKESDWGLTYKNYLGMLLLFENEQTLANRSMHIQESTIRECYGDMSFGMDKLMVQAKVDIEYSYQPVFPMLQVIDAEKRWKYIISAAAKNGYYTKVGIEG